MKSLYPALLSLTLACYAQEGKPKDPVSGINDAFEKHQVVMLVDIHFNRQEHEFLLKLISSPKFSRFVSDIVLEGVNARYQQQVDRYIAGSEIPIDQLRQVWRDGLGLGAVPDKLEEELFAAVRDANRRLPARRRLRIVCGEAPLDWSTVHTRDDLQPFMPYRDQNYVKAVKDQVLAKNHRALLYMGLVHFRRIAGQPSLIEQELQRAGTTTYVILPGSNIVGSYDDLEPRFEHWKWPWLLTLRNNWIGALPAQPILLGGLRGNAHMSGTLAEAADAFLFLGPRDQLTQFVPKRSELEGTAYAQEIERRLTIMLGPGKVPDFMPKNDDGQAPQYTPPQSPVH